MRAGVEHVGVAEGDQITGGREQAAPHRLALAPPGLDLGVDLTGAHHRRSGGAGDLDRGIGREGVDDHHLVEQARRHEGHERLEHPSDRGLLVAGREARVRWSRPRARFCSTRASRAKAPGPKVRNGPPGGIGAPYRG